MTALPIDELGATTRRRLFLQTDNVRREVSIPADRFGDSDDALLANLPADPEGADLAIVYVERFRRGEAAAYEVVSAARVLRESGLREDDKLYPVPPPVLGEIKGGPAK